MLGDETIARIPQRRPGFQPRRDPDRATIETTYSGRPSTKAGVSTPARPSCRMRDIEVEVPQRRPGFQPRRDPEPSRGMPTPPRSALNEGRGFNPGETRCLINPGEPMQVVELVPGPSTKAGVSTPARQEPKTGSYITGYWPLNEGRGFNPGETGVWRKVELFPSEPSTKAGVSTPARPRLRHLIGELVVPSTKAGVSTPARLEGRSAPDGAGGGPQRRPGFQPRRDLGSPATVTGPTHDPLNEGRGFNPGETAKPASQAASSKSPQRRPGFQPRRDRRAIRWFLGPLLPSTKAGVSTPARHFS